jgi:serine/threonine-protein kinase
MIVLEFLISRSGTILPPILVEKMAEPHLLNNRYQLQKILGKGGMSVVYQARDLMLERTVAIKVLRQDYSQDPAFRSHFRQEAKAAANLSHPNIVTVHDFGLDEGRLFIVMEYVPGTDLKSLLTKQSRFSVDEAIALMIQACAGVGYAHRAGLVHCDIKPQNMLITPDQRLKVLDFGIARALASIRPDEKVEVVWGSPQYFSPEQAAGKAPSPASDVYSLGVILYEMLTGVLPFTAPSVIELAQMHREVPPVPPRQFNPAIPDFLEEILLKVLAKEPAARYRTADQFGRVLTTLKGTQEAERGVAPPHPDEVESAIRPAAQVVPKPAPIVSPLSKTGQESGNPLEIDWITVALALLALIAVGGLLPFYLWVYFVFNPPIR